VPLNRRVGEQLADIHLNHDLDRLELADGRADARAIAPILPANCPPRTSGVLSTMRPSRRTSATWRGKPKMPPTRLCQRLCRRRARCGLSQPLI
jgi:hypothetical protein